MIILSATWGKGNTPEPKQHGGEMPALFLRARNAIETTFAIARSWSNDPGC